MTPRLVAPAIVVTSDEDLLDSVLAVGAAAATDLEVLPDASAVRRVWAAAAVIVIGVDQAPALAQLNLARRADVYLVGAESSRDVLHAWSAQVGAAVVLLPEGAGWLAAAIADVMGFRANHGRLLAVIGASGGAGASTWAAGLALAAARDGRQCLLVDADPLGGGLDLLLGAEDMPGWRWPRLLGARGYLGDLAGQLPQADGVDVLAMGRGPEQDPGCEAVRAVLLSARRTYDMVIVDLPRHGVDGTAEVLRRADLLVMAALADVRSVAAGRSVLAAVEVASPATAAVVRIPRSSHVRAEDVAEALEVPLLASVREDPAVRLALERGEPPGRGTRSGLGRACRGILDAVAVQGTAAA